ncbi:Uncharacterised protein [uncultured archaeon]|nr:Uncharacterised protein [uncultured archaeon]
MSLTSLIIDNRWVLEVLYAFVISAICMAIVFKTDKLYKISLHKGIRYFRNVFFFYGIAFIARYIFGVLSDSAFEYVLFAKVAFEYFIVMAGFFLLYSLIWRKFESQKTHYFTSLFNSKVAIFHLMALIIAVLDVLWGAYDFMFYSQIIVFVFASIISYNNYIKNGKERKFLKFSFLAMILGLSAWILNLVTEMYLSWSHKALFGIGLINIAFFFLFLYGVIKITNSTK